MGFAQTVFGFPSGKAYAAQLVKAPSTWAHRFFKVRSFEEQEDDAAEAGAGDMKKVLGAFDLICIGVGLMLGAGVFVTTGAVAANNAGPAVVLSYLVAGFSACLSSLCYAEFSANMPLSGGAYSYINAVFGEYLAWITVANLVLEYILANAAVIRGFSPYFALLINKEPDSLVTAYQNYTLDWFAFGWVLLLTIMLVLGTKESAMFNLVVTIVHIVLVVFIIIAGFVKSNPANAQPFVPYGTRGIFNGAAIVFFSYIGFDAVATSAEEVKNPKRDLPLGILGALSVVTICYILMSLALVMMVPISALTESGSFAAAFDYAGLHWARYIVALGALLGIVTGTLVGMFAVSRIIAAVARQHLLPPFLARVHKRFGTPHISTILSGVATAVIALFTSFDELLNMVSISTLFAFWIVALALMWKRYHKPSDALGRTALMAGQLVVLVGSALAFTIIYWVMEGQWIGLVITAAIFVAATISLAVTGGQGNRPASYCVPLFPFVPALSVGLNLFLLGQLDRDAYIRFGVWTAAVTGVYMFFGSLASQQHVQEQSGNLPVKRAAIPGDGLPVNGRNSGYNSHTTAGSAPVVEPPAGEAAGLTKVQ